MNSFFVPQLGSQIYTMGGMTTHLNLLADKPGEYPGFSANYSGDGFAEMRFIAKAVPAGRFRRLGRAGARRRAALDAPGYAALAKPSQAVPPATYRSVEPEAVRAHRRPDGCRSRKGAAPAAAWRSAGTAGRRLRCWAG